MSLRTEGCCSVRILFVDDFYNKPRVRAQPVSSMNFRCKCSAEHPIYSAINNREARSLCLPSNSSTNTDIRTQEQRRSSMVKHAMLESRPSDKHDMGSTADYGHTLTQPKQLHQPLQWHERSRSQSAL